MSRKFKSLRFLTILICLFCSAIFINGQDLGSSNDLFRPKDKKETPKKAPPKTTTPKRKSSPPTRTKRTSTKSDSTGKTNSNKGKTQVSRNKVRRMNLETLQNSKLDDDVIITVGEKNGEDTIENADELYEDAIIEGNLARNLRNYMKAEKAYTRAKTIKPMDSRAIYGLGNLYSNQQRWEEAEMAYRRAIELEPDNPNAHITLSFVLTQPTVGTNSGMRYAEAEKTARKAIELSPDNPFGYDQLGVAKQLQGIVSKKIRKMLIERR